jgi:hypothetical protein
MTKRPSILGNLPQKSAAEVPQADGGTVTEKKTASKGEAAMVKTTAYFSRAVHEKLREIAFTERKSINDLMLEGLDYMLQQRSYPTTKQLTDRAKAS